VRIIVEPDCGLDVCSPEFGGVEQRRPAVDVGSIVVAGDGALQRQSGDERAVVPFGGATAGGQRRGA